ncbi:MAG: hypothetical protein BWY91_02236 [bacterium ADurb.BinA028]|nr:MAG: hypothetical protein BWY91_02236 [bacterium ADurb.BinA028]
MRCQHLLRLRQLSEQPGGIGVVHALPHPTDGLALQTRQMPQQEADRQLSVGDSGQVSVEPIIEIQTPLVAQRHDHHGREGLRDRPNHERCVVGGGRDWVQPGGADMHGVDELPVAHQPDRDVRSTPRPLPVGDEMVDAGLKLRVHGAGRSDIGP